LETELPHPETLE